MKLLLGGIPLGYDNIGDEAILACVVKMLRDSVPGVELTVATSDPQTAERLGVQTVPPFGFKDKPVSWQINADAFTNLVRKFDAYIWCGATGLSDYPNDALDLLELAQATGTPTFVWGVGMDDELNPVFFRAHGKRRLLLKLFGLTGWYERHLRERLKRRIATILPQCHGVWVRDPQSAAMLASMGFDGAGVTADTAILMAPQQEKKPHGSAKRLGLCISTQRQVADLDGVRKMIADVRQSSAEIIGIPMNPKTDKPLLESLGVECISGTSPEEVVAAAGECDAVLSSRLHLLILAANAGTPGLGIARGSKLQNWLSNFGRTVEGSVYECDWEKVTRHVLAQLADRGEWDKTREAAYAALMARFTKAREDFIGRLPK